MKKLPATDRDRERSSNYLTAKKDKKRFRKEKFSAETKKSMKHKSKKSKKRREGFLHKSVFEGESKPMNTMKHKKSSTSTISEALRTPLTKKALDYQDRKLAGPIYSSGNKSKTFQVISQFNSKDAKLKNLKYQPSSGKKPKKKKSTILEKVKTLNKTILSKKSLKEKPNYYFKGALGSHFSGGDRSNQESSGMIEKEKNYGHSNELNSPSTRTDKSKKRRKNVGNNSVYERILHSNVQCHKKLGDLNDGVSKQLLGHKSVDLPKDSVKEKSKCTYGSHMMN